MSYGRTCFSGVHVFQVDMCYESIRVKGDHALLEQMSCGWSCVSGVHVFKMAYLVMRYVLLVEIAYWMFCLMVCIIGGHVLQFQMFYWSTYFTEGILNRLICLA